MGEIHDRFGPSLEELNSGRDARVKSDARRHRAAEQQLDRVSRSRAARRIRCFERPQVSHERASEIRARRRALAQRLGVRRVRACAPLIVERCGTEPLTSRDCGRPSRLWRLDLLAPGAAGAR